MQLEYKLHHFANFCSSRFSLCQMFSIIFKSGDCAGHDSILILFFTRYSITFWALWIGALSSWKIGQLLFWGKWRATTGHSCLPVCQCTSERLYYLQGSPIPSPLNVMHPQNITPSRFVGGGEVQAGSHCSPALLHMYTLLSSPISTLDSSLNITLFQWNRVIFSDESNNSSNHLQASTAFLYIKLPGFSCWPSES